MLAAFVCGLEALADLAVLEERVKDAVVRAEGDHQAVALVADVLDGAFGFQLKPTRRLACLGSFPLTFRSLPFIVGKPHDLSAKVRERRDQVLPRRQRKGRLFHDRPAFLEPRRNAGKARRCPT
jgi:hypothetical protein